LLKDLAPSAFTTYIASPESPDTVVIDAMFMLSPPPSPTSATFGEYAVKLYNNWVTYYFRKYSTVSVVALAFDKQDLSGQTIKQFERRRRDDKASKTAAFDIISESTKLPTKWLDFIKNRRNKQLLVNFISNSFCTLASDNLISGQTLLLSGGFPQASKSVTVQKGCILAMPQLQHNHEEGDSLVWLLAAESAGSKILIYSPDNDTYNIGLPLAWIYPNKLFTIQLKSHNYESQFLSLKQLVATIRPHSNLKEIESLELLLTLQSLFICTGCDYISYFKHHSKRAFYQTFLNNTDFIQGLTKGTEGNLSLTSDTDRELGFLAFLRLVGCEYFVKYCSAFLEESPDGRPESLYLHLYDPKLSTLQNHSQWLSVIRNAIMFRSPSEDYYIPSDDALQLHWCRCCWVNKVWQQADKKNIAFPDPNLYGWVIEGGLLSIKWDSEFNYKKTDQYVHLWTEGCTCKKDKCQTKRCGCKRQDKSCGPGCLCKALCYNAPPDPTVVLEPSHVMATPDGDDRDNDTMITHERQYEPLTDQEIESDSDTDNDDHDSDIYR
jgi:hypothetical protein